MFLANAVGVLAVARRIARGNESRESGIQAGARKNREAGLTRLRQTGLSLINPHLSHAKSAPWPVSCRRRSPDPPITVAGGCS